MSDARAKVLELLAQGTVSPAEAEELLAAMRPAPRPWWSSLSNPMALGMPAAVVTSVVAAAITLALNARKVHFDGPFDTYLVSSAPSWGEAFAALALNWFGVALLLFAAARIFSQRGRLHELVLIVGVARLPLALGGVIAALYALAGGPVSAESPAVLALVLPLLLLLAAAVVAIVRGFSTVTGLRGSKLLAVCGVTLLLAEVGLKALLMSVGI